MCSVAFSKKFNEFTDVSVSFIVEYVMDFDIFGPSAFKKEQTNTIYSPL